MLKYENVLVTGTSGLIGRNLAIRLRDLGAIVTGTYHQNHINVDGIKNVYANLTTDVYCSEVTKNKDIVFHCAAVTEGAKTMSKNPKRVVTPNAVMTSLLMDRAQENGVKKFVYLSSTTVDLPEDYLGISQMKRFGEDLCRFYREKYKMNTLVVRPTNVYGPFDKFDERGHFVPNLIERALNRENPFVVWGDGSNIRDLIYAEDLADGIIEATENNYQNATIGSGNLYSVSQVAGEILKITGNIFPITYDLTKPNMVKVNQPKLDLVKNYTPLEYGLLQTINWRKNERLKAKR